MSSLVPEKSVSGTTREAQESNNLLPSRLSTKYRNYRRKRRENQAEEKAVEEDEPELLLLSVLKVLLDKGISHYCSQNCRHSK